MRSRRSVGGTDGTAVAIVDKSGTLSLIENSGAITATGATATSNRNVAIDLSANTAGATVKQTAVAATFTAPSIAGDVRFGTGSDTLDVADGKLSRQCQLRRRATIGSCCRATRPQTAT